MINKLLRHGSFTFAKKRVTDIDNAVARHLPTTNLWATGDGILPKREMLVSGWNVNGIRSVLKKDKLVPFLD